MSSPVETFQAFFDRLPSAARASAERRENEHFVSAYWDGYMIGCALRREDGMFRVASSAPFYETKDADMALAHLIRVMQ